MSVMDEAETSLCHARKDPTNEDPLRTIEVPSLLLCCCMSDEKLHFDK